MGRDVGALALHTGVAVGADAILIPEIRFKPEKLIEHIRKIENDTGRDYGLIVVSEAIKMRGHSGRAGDMISRELKKANINNRPVFPTYRQRTGDTCAADRILAARFAACAMDAAENHETYMMCALQGDDVKTIPITDMFQAGEIKPDPHVPNVFTSNHFVSDNDPLLETAVQMGAYIGEIK